MHLSALFWYLWFFGKIYYVFGNFYTTAIRARVRKKLLQYNLITDFPEEGRRKPYILGEDGFDYIIQFHFDEIVDLQNFTKTCSKYFPLVYGYWEELQNCELDIYIKDSLRGIIKKIYVDIVRELIIGERERYSHQEFVNDLYTRLYLPEMFFDKDEISDNIIDKILIFRDNKPEILKFLQEWIAEEKSKYYKRIERLEEVEKRVMHK